MEPPAKTFVLMPPRVLAKIVVEKINWPAKYTRATSTLETPDVMQFVDEVIQENIPENFEYDVSKFRSSISKQVHRLLNAIDPSDKDLNGTLVTQKSHGHQLLTDVEEMILLGLLISQRHNQVRLTQPHIKATAISMFGLAKGNFSRNWVRAFEERHKDILFRSGKSRKIMKAARVANTTFDQALIFSRVFQGVLESFQELQSPVSPQFLCNCDETLINIVRNGKVDIELVPRGVRTGSGSPPPGLIGSMLCFVTASGDVPLVVFVMKKASNERGVRVPKLTDPIVGTKNARQRARWIRQHHFFSPTGYVSEQHFQSSLQLFADVMSSFSEYEVPISSRPSPLLLLADNLKIHRTEATLSKAVELKIHLQMLSPNASHFLQPLDDVLFASFKACLKAQYNILDPSLSTLRFTHPSALASCVPYAFQEAFTPSLIKLAWQNVGLWPYSHEKILANATLSTHRGGSKKYSKGAPAALRVELQAFQAAFNVAQSALESVLNHTETTTFETLESSDIVFAKQTNSRRRQHRGFRANSVTAVFQETGGLPGPTLAYETAHNLEKENEIEEKEKRKSEREDKKRKREIEEREKEERKKEKENEKRRKLETEKRRMCKFEGCKKKWDEGLKRKDFWFWCEGCSSFFLCAVHKRGESGVEMIKEHDENCSIFQEVTQEI